MKKVSILFILILISVIGIYAKDDGKSFRLVIPETTKVSNSLYNNIEFLDSRNNYEYDLLRIDPASFLSQLNTLLQALTNETAHDATLFIQLRDLSLEKESKNEGEYAHLRITLYERINSDYLMIGTTDEKIPLPKPKEYMETISQAITDIISSNLLQAYTDPKPFTLENVHHIAFFEKENLKVYNTNSFANGIYLTFLDFINQVPDERKITTKFKKGELKEIKIINPENNKERKLDAAYIFAVVIDGQPYISVDNKYIPMYKVDDDFYFEDEISNSKVGFAPSFSFGIGSGGYRGAGIGLGIYGKSAKQKINFRIDHLNGDFVPAPERNH